MAHIYDHLLAALKAHWKAHNNAYPQKFILSPADNEVLKDARGSINKAVTGKDFSTHATFMDVKIEVRDGSPGIVVAVDGTETPLSTL
jgi:hypothetical protein